jgi:hypothetical protein
MKNNETGEFELVLGNRQLLSGFFIVALLFGVAFAMGYIVGRNSTPSPKLQAETGATTTAVNQEPRPQPATPAPSQPSDAQAPSPRDNDAKDTAQPDSDTPAQPTTQPAKEGPAAAPPVAAESKPSENQEPAAGTYWQAIATTQAGAEIVAKALHDKGFPVLLTPGTKGLTRVLIGPYSETDTQALGRAKTDLEKAGFHPIILKK